MRTTYFTVPMCLTTLYMNHRRGPCFGIVVDADSRIIVSEEGIWDFVVLPETVQRNLLRPSLYTRSTQQFRSFRPPISQHSTQHELQQFYWSFELKRVLQEVYLVKKTHQMTKKETISAILFEMNGKPFNAGSQVPLNSLIVKSALVTLLTNPCRRGLRITSKVVLGSGRLFGTVRSAVWSIKILFEDDEEAARMMLCGKKHPRVFTIRPPLSVESTRDELQTFYQRRELAIFFEFLAKKKSYAPKHGLIAQLLAMVKRCDNELLWT